jgi:hypothetical protein
MSFLFLLLALALSDSSTLFVISVITAEDLFKPKTIQILMICLCTSRFDIESEQHTFIEEYLTAQEIQAVKEKRKTERLDDDVFDLISDTEEDPSS